MLTPDLNTNIIRSLPIKLGITFNNKYTAFINLDTDNNICSPAVFKFLNQYVENLNSSFKANPLLFDEGLSRMNVEMKPVRYEIPKKQERNSSMPAWINQDKTCRSCPLCSVKGFELANYPLSWKCVVKKLSSVEIIKTMDDARVCPSCCCTIRLNSIANLPSWTAPTGSALRTALRTAPTTGFPWTAMPAITTTKLHLSLAPSWDPTSPFLWLNPLKRTRPHSASNMT